MEAFEQFPSGRREGERRQGERRGAWPDYVDASPEERLTRNVDGLCTAVFGNPLDRDDHGLVGAVREVGEKLDRLFHGMLGVMGTLIVVAVTITIALK